MRHTKGLTSTDMQRRKHDKERGHNEVEESESRDRIRIEILAGGGDAK